MAHSHPVVEAWLSKYAAGCDPHSPEYASHLGAYLSGSLAASPDDTELRRALLKLGAGATPAEALDFKHHEPAREPWYTTRIVIIGTLIFSLWMLLGGA